MKIWRPSWWKISPLSLISSAADDFMQGQNIPWCGFFLSSYQSDAHLINVTHLCYRLLSSQTCTLEMRTSSPTPWENMRNLPSPFLEIMGLYLCLVCDLFCLRLLCCRRMDDCGHGTQFSIAPSHRSYLRYTSRSGPEALELHSLKAYLPTASLAYETPHLQTLYSGYCDTVENHSVRPLKMTFPSEKTVCQCM